CGGGNMCCTGVCRECCAHTDCNDSNPCTNDTCSAGGVCSNTVVGDRTPCGGGNVCCLGECVECCTLAECDDGNQCTYDRCNSSHVCVNRDEDDMTVCASGGGVCCNGTCRSGGECCVDSNCSPRCRGTATACNSIGSSSACSAQTGCSWDPAGPCGGDGKGMCHYFIQGAMPGLRLHMG
ncbi:MAG: hypothetical protein ABIJ56_09870, partial [Pseudomonadota bacterium]